MSEADPPAESAGGDDREGVERGDRSGAGPAGTDPSAEASGGVVEGAGGHGRLGAGPGGRIREDPDLQAPPAPDRVPRMGGVQPELALAGPAEEAGFAVEGRQVSALGTERGRINWIRLDERVVAADLGVDQGMVANVVVSPGILRRERLGDGVYATETVLAAPTLPLLAWQLTVPDQGAIPDELPVSVTLLPGATSVRHHVTDDALVAVDEAEPERRVVLAVVPGPEFWSVGPAETGGLHCRVHLSVGQETTLLLTAGREERVRTALRAGAHLPTHEHRAAGPPDEGTVVRTGVAAVDDGVGWARARVAAALWRREPVTDPDSLGSTVLGALAGGDVEAARTGLSALDEIGVPDDPMALLLAARFTLTTGDTRPAERALERLGGGEVRGPDRLRARALATLADALAHSAPDDVVQSLRSRASVRRTPGGGVRLPMAGAPEATATHPTDHLAWLLGPSGTPAPGGTPPEDLAAWSAARRGDPPGAWSAWRAELERGARPEPWARGAWDDPTGGAGAPGAATILATLIHGILGWEADAPVGRVTFAPVLPPHLTRFEADGLLAGDVRIDLAYRREGSTVRWELTPTAGRSPPMFVFSPLLPGAPRSLTLDGEPADVDAAPAPHGARLSFQFVLDRPRTVAVELADPADEARGA